MGTHGPLVWKQTVVEREEEERLLQVQCQQEEGRTLRKVQWSLIQTDCDGSQCYSSFALKSHHTWILLLLHLRVCQALLQREKLSRILAQMLQKCQVHFELSLFRLKALWMGMRIVCLIERKEMRPRPMYHQLQPNEVQRHVCE